MVLLYNQGYTIREKVRKNLASMIDMPISAAINRTLAPSDLDDKAIDTTFRDWTGVMSDQAVCPFLFGYVG